MPLFTPSMVRVQESTPGPESVTTAEKIVAVPTGVSIGLMELTVTPAPGGGGGGGAAVIPVPETGRLAPPPPEKIAVSEEEPSEVGLN